MGTIGRDVRCSLRVMAKNRVFTAVALLTLALGIGANTVVFSVVDAVVLRTLPYRDPGRLAWATNFVPLQRQNLVSDTLYFGWRQQNHAFDDLAAFSVD